MKIVYKSYIVLLSLVLCVLASCQVNKYGDMSGIVEEWEKIKPQPIDTLVFKHPCALYTEADFNRVSHALVMGSAPVPVQEEFDKLKINQLVMGDYGVTSHAKVEVVRGDPKGTIEGVENYPTAMRDAASAYQFGLLYNLTIRMEGHETEAAQYAQRGIFILNDLAKPSPQGNLGDGSMTAALDNDQIHIRQPPGNLHKTGPLLRFLLDKITFRRNHRHTISTCLLETVTVLAFLVHIIAVAVPLHHADPQAALLELRNKALDKSGLAGIRLRR